MRLNISQISQFRKLPYQIKDLQLVVRIVYKLDNECAEIEKEFLNLIQNIPLINTDINNKRKQLGNFEFINNLSTEGLILVNGKSGMKGETYYGFQ